MSSSTSSKASGEMNTSEKGENPKNPEAEKGKPIDAAEEVAGQDAKADDAKDAEEASAAGRAAAPGSQADETSTSTSKEGTSGGSADEQPVNSTADTHGEASDDASRDAAEPHKDAGEDEPPAEQNAPQSETQEEEADTLDLRALFANSETDFASPTETFERARAADTLGRPGTSQPSTTDAEPDLPLDPPYEGARDADKDAGNQPAPVRRDQMTGHGAAQSAFGQGDTRPDIFTTGEPGDPLADAVQSALRSVYGDDGGDAARNSTDLSGAGANGPVLQWARSPAETQPSPEPSQNDASAGSLGDSRVDTGIDEETTEAVLSYLYEHLGSEETLRATPPETGRLDIPSSVDLDSSAQDRDVWTSGQRDGNARLSAELESVSHAHARSEQADDLAPEPGTDFAEPAATEPAHETFHPPIEVGSVDTEASGKFLGAAGLGLIGGIAAAGVAAVFVFNSFVTQSEAPSGQETAATLSKGERTAGGKETASLTGGDRSETRDMGNQSAEDGPRAAGSSDQTAATPNGPGADASTPPTRTAALSTDTGDSATAPDAGGETSAQSVRAEPVEGEAGGPLPVDLSVPEPDGDGFVRIDGLPEGVKFSAGVDTGNGSWLLSAGRAEGLELTPPESFAGEFTLEAQLLDSDARTPLGDSVSFDVSIAEASPSEADETAETATAAIEPDTEPTALNQAPTSVDRARSLLRAGDVLAAREILRREAAAGNAQAALALGRSFDPMTFRELTSANANPDATEAFRWYRKATELGHDGGQTKIAELKAWLLR